MNTLLFLSSYALLFAALALRFTEAPLRMACSVLFAVGFFGLLGIINAWKGRSAFTITISTADDRGGEVGGYLVTYLLPLLVVPEPNGWDLGAYALILFVVGLVYVRSRMVQINPILYLFGLRLFFIESTGGFRGYLVAKHEPKPGVAMRVARRENVLLSIEGN